MVMYGKNISAIYVYFIYKHYICKQIPIMWSIMENLNRIKVVLVEQNKTGKWLAEQLGKDRSTVSKWCSNKIQPDLATLSKIAGLLNVDIRELLNKSM